MSNGYIFSNNYVIIISCEDYMGNIEKEIKILNIDVFKILNKLEELGIKTKGKYIQDIYTYDLP